MITIQGVGQYNEDYPFLSQPNQVVADYLLNVIITFNYYTALTKDNWDRPLTWEYIGEGVKITSERIYDTQDGNYYVKEQTYKIEAHGNI